jgi:hypothetical protein
MCFKVNYSILIHAHKVMVGDVPPKAYHKVLQYSCNTLLCGRLENIGHVL